MDLKTILEMITKIWNASPDNWNVTGLIKAIFNFKVEDQVVLLQMLPKWFAKENRDEIIMWSDKRLQKRLDYVLQRVWDGKRLTNNNDWVIESYLDMFDLDEEGNTILRQPVTIHDAHETFKRIAADEWAKKLALMQALKITPNPAAMFDLSAAKVASGVKKLAREKKKQLDMAGVNTIYDDTLNSLFPNMMFYSIEKPHKNKQGKITSTTEIEVIKIKGSSWLNLIYYDHGTHDAAFELKTAPNKKYIFYNVPRVAISWLEVFRGKEMWNGFGLKYSLFPFHWVRRNTFLHHIKHAELNYKRFRGQTQAGRMAHHNRFAKKWGWERPTKTFRDIYKARKPS